MGRAKERFFTNHAKLDAMEPRGIFHLMPLGVACSFVMVPVIQNAGTPFVASLLTRPQMLNSVGLAGEIGFGQLRIK